MWYLWLALLSAACSAAPAPASEAGRAAGGPSVGGQPVVLASQPVGTTARPPMRTLDRKAAELAWRSWLQSPDSGNLNAPPRRITTKSLFITPLVCPKGQRLDRDACVQVVTVNKEEHERILLDSLNALFTSPPGSDFSYDYGEDEPGPLQLSIPIGLEPQASPLQADSLPQLDGIKIDKKEAKPGGAESIEAELELLKLQQQAEHRQNDTDKIALTHNTNNLPFAEKPKRDSPIVNDTETHNNTDHGQKELVYGHVNVDPVLYYQNQQLQDTTVESETETDKPAELSTTGAAEDDITTTEATVETTTEDELVTEETTTTSTDIVTKTEIQDKTVLHQLKKDIDKTKLNPENDYSDIGEAIKLISRYAEVTTDDSFSKDQTKMLLQDEGILGTRTKLQHRRNKFKAENPAENPAQNLRMDDSAEIENREKIPTHSFYPKTEYYRYPWLGQHSPTPPPGYPFHHLQDYWPGRTQYGGVYNTAHENPRRHHHSYPHTFYRPHGGPNSYGYVGSHPVPQDTYVGQHLGAPHRLVAHHADPMRSRNSNQDLYSLLGLRHWFSSEGTAKR